MGEGIVVLGLNWRLVSGRVSSQGIPKIQTHEHGTIRIPFFVTPKIRRDSKETQIHWPMNSNIPGHNTVSWFSGTDASSI